MDEPMYHVQSATNVARDFQKAIAALNASTRRMLEHTRVLEEQRQFLESCRSEQTGQQPENRVSHQRALEMQHVQSLNEELSQNIGSRLHNQQEKIEQAIKASPSAFNARMNSDNRKFDNIEQNDYLKRTIESSELAKHSHRSYLLLERLRAAIRERVKLRLNRKYLESLEQDSNLGNLQKESCSTRVQEVDDDLTNLHGEIDDVTELLVDHDYGQRLCQLWEVVVSMEHTNTVQQGQIISKEIASLANELELLSDRQRNLQCHRTTVAKFNDHHRSIATKAQNERRRSSTSSAGDSFALASLRRHLDSTSEDSETKRREVIGQDYKNMYELVKASSETSVRYSKKILNSVDSELQTVGQTLDGLDKWIATVKANIDRPILQEPEFQRRFRAIWVDN